MEILEFILACFGGCCVVMFATNVFVNTSKYFEEVDYTFERHERELLDLDREFRRHLENHKPRTK